MFGLSDVKLKKVNLGLSLLVVTLGLYISLIPFWPQISLWLKNKTDDGGFVYAGELSQGQDGSKLKPPPENNTLLIPSIRVDEEIVIGDNPSNVHLGVWHRPNTSTPDQGGNTVFVGHRFSYSDPSVFYHLDKMKVGERFAVWWNDKEYVYEVFETVVVPATALEIEGPSEEPMVTLYTCTPMWTAKDRLVVKASLVESTQESEEQS